jgi:hypothetical protein
LAEEQPRRAKRGLLGNLEPARFDHVWAVIDTDVAVREGFWNDVVQLADAKKVKLAHSTPCFESWLLLHIASYTKRNDLRDGKVAKATLKKALDRDYDTNAVITQKAIESLIDPWPQAVTHAITQARQLRQHHREAGTKPPGNPSSEMDQLITAMQDSARP